MPHAGINLDPVVIAVAIPVVVWFFCDLTTGNRLRPPAGFALTLGWLLSAGVLMVGVQVDAYLQWLAVGGAQAGCFLVVHLLHKLFIPTGRNESDEDDANEPEAA